MQKISTFLWFDTQAEEAATFYTSIFKNSKITSTSHCGEAGPGLEGSVLTVGFELDGQEFTALNGGPDYKFTPAISLLINCKTQDEVDYFWEKLTADGGQEVQCGWVSDKYGLSWQVVPEGFLDCVMGEDEAGAARAMQAMYQMKKLDLNAIRKAYAGA